MSLCTIRNKKFATLIVILFMATFLFTLYTFTTNLTPASADDVSVDASVVDDSGTLEIHLYYDLDDVIDGLSWFIDQFTDVFSSDNNSDNSNSECECGCGEGSSCSC
ncbi:MAG: hypothetical protein OXH00_05440 [Candidatus Poribacteria bacterium]|nr:hypothetical protein [Candidatus Poribacteria bacterium]